MLRVSLAPLLCLSLALLACNRPVPAAHFEPNTLWTYIPDLEITGCGSSGYCPGSSQLTPEQVLANYQKTNPGFTLETYKGHAFIADQDGHALRLKAREQDPVSYDFADEQIDSSGGRGDTTGEYWVTREQVIQAADEQMVSEVLIPENIMALANARHECSKDYPWVCLGYTVMNPSTVERKLSEAADTEIRFNERERDYQFADENTSITMQEDSGGWTIRAQPVIDLN